MVHIVIAASAAKQLKSPVLHRTIADSAAQRLKSPVFTFPLPRCLVSMRSPRPGSQAGVAEIELEEANIDGKFSDILHYNKTI